MSDADECQAARQAQAVIASLMPETLRTDANVFAIRHAAGCASDAVKNRREPGPLDDARTEAGIVLGALAGLMEVSAVTPLMIQPASNAVAVWLRELS